jgi:hypothetical protein
MAKASRMVLTDRDVQLATADIAPEKINAALAKFARDELRNVIASGEASTNYQKFVTQRVGGSGVEGAEEETVQAPGPIFYRFAYWEPILRFTLQELERRSPVKTGRYQSSHRVMIGSQFIAPDAPIAADEMVVVVNTQPYSRKIEVGFMRMSMPDGVYEDVMRKVRSQFGRAVQVNFKMVMLPNGYILKGVFKRGYKPGARRKLGKDTQAGAKMTYPSLQMMMR